MHEREGRYIQISASRRIIMDMMHEARQVPSIPVQRIIDLKDLVEIRSLTQPRVSWFVIFMKAFSIVARENPQLRRSLISWPFSRFYEHPHSNCSLAVEREYEGENCLFFTQFRAPECQSLRELQSALDRYKTAPIESIGLYRRSLEIGALPRIVRKCLWWMSLNVSGPKRAKRMGTFGLTGYGALDAESMHPISPISYTLNFGPISKDHHVSMKIIYDHRILDGSDVARRLKNLDEVLQGQIRAELLAMMNNSHEEIVAEEAEKTGTAIKITHKACHANPEPHVDVEHGLTRTDSPAPKI